ncbi:hypothetical protein [Flavobacterium filum]|uniref:hypothetical protein n=1 Tax=Flavobacterium filum TaxID=370974 RepID=UPI0023F05B23|nr:hypothetical protein [Flavobacterium filum]
MDYSTYWSVLDTPSKSIQTNSVCLYIAIGAGLLWLLAKKFKKDKGDGDKTIMLWATSAFAVLGLAGYIMLTFFYQDKSNEKTLEMLNSPTTPRIEGVVSNFERTSRNGKETIEKFTVDSIQFAYGDAALGKFNSFSQTNNSVIFDGQKVRITYSSGSRYGNYNSILKLEIAK